MVSKIYLITSLFALTACTSEVKITAPPCAEIIGVDALLSSQKSEIIVIGEVHGMTAPPEFISALVCHSLAQGVQTTLALEMSDDDGLLSDYMTSDGGKRAQTALFRDEMWTTGFTDGRSSTAMFTMIDKARVTMANDELLRVGVFASRDYEDDKDATPSEKSSRWEKYMATNLLTLADRSERTIVLVGNLHARYGDVSFGERTYDLMAEHLPRDRTRTFNALSAPGTVWNCIFNTKTCESRTSGGAISIDHPITQDGRFRVLLAEELEGALGEKFRYDPSKYDGLIFVGTAIAAPPANAKGREPLDWQ